MKLFIYSNLNVIAGYFSPLVCERIEPDEMTKDYAQIISGFDEKSLFRLKECDLYCLGSIDNVTGEIVPEKQFLLHCGEVCDKFLAARVKSEVSKDEGKAC